MLFLDWVQGHCFDFDVNISEKESMTIATIVKFEVILMDTRKSMVSLNKFLK